MRFRFYRNWQKYVGLVLVHDLYVPDEMTYIGNKNWNYSMQLSTYNGAGKHQIYAFVVPPAVYELDVFLCGRGGNGAGYKGTYGAEFAAGGGGGYTKTFKKNTLAPYSWTRDGGAIAVIPGETLYFGLDIGSAASGKGGSRVGRIDDVNEGYYKDIGTCVALSGGNAGASNSGSNGGNGGSGGGACKAATTNLGGSNGANGSSATLGTGGAGQGHTTRPFAEDGSWATGLNLPLQMNVPFGAGGSVGSIAGYIAQYGGGGAVDAIAGYGGGGGTVSNNPNTQKLPALGCVIIRWMV